MPPSGQVDDKTKEKVRKNVDDVIKDLAKDPNIDIDNITRDDLKKRGLQPDTIDEIMRLKKIHDELKDPNAKINAKDLRKELDDAANKLEKDAQDHKKKHDDDAKVDKEQNDLKKARLQPNPEVIQRIRIWKIPNKLNRHKNQILKIRKFPKHSLINKNKKTPMRLQLQKKTISRRIRIQRSNRLLSNLVPFLN